MRKVKSKPEDELKPEYDLSTLRVRKVGAGRKEPVHLDPDVAKMFPDSESVNEALRFMIRILRENKQTLRSIGNND